MKIIHKNMKVLLMLLGLMVSNLTIAQVISLSGRVTDSRTGEPLPGVSIVEKGTVNGTISNIDGDYSLSVEKGKTVQFS